MSEPEQKCEKNPVFKQNYTAKLLITFKMAHSCCFSLGGNLDFLQKKFYNFYNYRIRVLVNSTYLYTSHIRYKYRCTGK